MTERKLGHNQAISAAKAGFCERSGRTLEKLNSLPSQRPLKRGRKPGSHLFASVWDKEIEPLLKRSPTLSALAILEHLQDSYPGRYDAKNLRTLQRLVRHWRAVHGQEKEVMFRQVHQPGQQGLSDFTAPKTFAITIKGQAFEHLLYHFRLAYSCWSYLEVVQGGESFSALSQGLQNALHRLNGCPQEHRTDSLAAGFKNLTKEAKEDLTQRYEHLCHHYRMIPTRNNRSKSHENGSVEAAHGHLKRRTAQALILRGSHDFASVEDYQCFLDVVANRHNKRHQKQIDAERPFLQSLPLHRSFDYELLTVRVTTSSTIFVKNVVYSVPSRLIGQQLRIHLYSDRLIGYLGYDHLFEFKRQKSIPGKRQYCINYRHVIKSLAIKPQAFRYSVLKEALLPNTIYQEIWQILNRDCVSRQACKLMVGILKLAADYDCEAELGRNVLSLLKKGQVPSLGSLQRRFEKNQATQPDFPEITIPVQRSEVYGQLFSNFNQGVSHA